MSKYNRPFMVVFHTMRVPKGTNTSKKGWMDEAGLLVEENVEFTTRVKTKYWNKAAVIIDLLGKNVKKNRYTEKSNDEVITYFYNKYRDQIKSFIVQFMLVHGRNVETDELSALGETKAVNTMQPR